MHMYAVLGDVSLRRVLINLPYVSLLMRSADAHNT